MKALTGLPTQVYAQVGEEASIPVADLLKLVQGLESHLDPSFIARYRPDISYGLGESQIRFIHTRLREYGDLADRRIAVLTSLSQQARLTPELRTQIESVRNRRELDDLFAPFKTKPRAPADDAIEAGLEPLARFLWSQQTGDLSAEAEKYLNPEKGVASSEDALAGAREIIARWLAENGEVRSDLRRVVSKTSQVVVEEVPAQRKLSAKDSAARQRYTGAFGRSFGALSLPWKQVLSLRRGTREGWLRYGTEIPREQCLEYLRKRLLQDPESAVAAQLEEAATHALDTHLASGLEGTVRQDLEERCDSEAIASYAKNLKRTLMQAPAGAKVVIGLEVSRPGGWRAAVISAQGQLLEAAIVKADPSAASRSANAPETDSETAGKAESTDESGPAQVELEKDESPVETEAASESRAESVDVAPEQCGAEVVVEAAEQVLQTAEAVTTAAAEEPAADAPTADTPEVAVADVVAPTDAVEALASESVAEAVAEEPAADAPTADAPEVAVADVVAEAVAEEPVTEAAEDQPSVAETGETAPEEAPATETAEDGAAAEASVSERSQTARKERPRSSRKLDRIDTPSAELSELIARHNPDFIVMGNTPQIRQVERFVRSEVKKSGKRVGWVTVNESGSWIYATSRAARQEFPGAEPAVRAATCLARRFQDPLGEAARLDYRVLGVGQGHHEVDQKSLRDELRRQAASCANAVGVDLNRAPAELLELVPGMTDRVAKRIVELRGEKGPFPSLAAAEKMPGMNKRVWEQAAGFFRVFGRDNPLDETGVHPKDYAKALALIEAAGSSVQECIANPGKLDGLDLAPFVDAEHPEAVLEAIVKEFDPRRLNPRGPFKPPKAGSDLDLIEEPKAGMKVRGIVTNSASFGVCVDIGAEQDGLLHISQLPEEMISDDRPKVAAGAELTVYITHFDSHTGKLSLSMREARDSSRQRRTAPGARAGGGASRPRRPFEEGRPRPERAPVTRTFGPDKDEQVRARKQVENMSLPEKLAALGDKFRTKI
ncbi:MAG: helix-hairpin-helix domain-containing protein [Acidobacteria bacterium]|nr:helix-hairpin-helix domain-containing protein [Acidobacteriota bacterium]